MLARDINSNPTQYRTWIVSNNPDFTGQFYTGLKSGTNAFVDVSAYAITDDSIIADFNLPLPDNWTASPTEIVLDFPIRKVLPDPIEDSQLAILGDGYADGYIYMFGSKVNNKIYRANLNNPADWIDTGARLPGSLYGSSLAIVDGYIYLFGGNDGYSDGYQGISNNIYTAPVTNPLSWTNQGPLLPRRLQYSNLGMYNGKLYLFGGQEPAGASAVILTAPISNPLVWTDTGFRLPVATYGSTFAQLDGYWMMFGGLLAPNSPTRNILRSSVNSPTSWSSDGYLPYATAFGQFFTVGNDGYMIGPMVGAVSTGFTPIIQCHLNSPNVFFDTQKIVPGVISHSQYAIIYDRVWLFGGSGETAIFACNQDLKYNLYSPVAQAYGQITRTFLSMTDNLHNPYQALGIPYWRTNYKF